MGHKFLLAQEQEKCKLEKYNTMLAAVRNEIVYLKSLQS